MEIRLVERNPKTKRIKNVEIYSEKDFFMLVHMSIKYAIKNSSLWQLLSCNYRAIAAKTEKFLKVEFKDRIAKNLN